MQDILGKWRYYQSHDNYYFMKEPPKLKNSLGNISFVKENMWF